MLDIHGKAIAGFLHCAAIPWAKAQPVSPLFDNFYTDE